MSIITQPPTDASGSIGGCQSSHKSDPPKTTSRVTPFSSSGFGSIRFGDITSQDILRIGNHVDALKYFSSQYVVSKPTGQLDVQYDAYTNDGTSYHRLCGGYERYDFDKMHYSWKSFGLPLVDDSTAKFSAAEIHFCKSVAGTKARRNIRKAAASVPMLFAERTATLKTIKNRSNDLIDLIHRRHNSDLAGYRKIRGTHQKKRFAKKIANDHLEFIFGILPVIDDLQGLCHLAVGERFDYVKSSGVQSITRSDVLKRKKVQKYSDPSYILTQKVSETLGYRCALRADITSSIMNDAQKLGLSPVYTAYDLIPLSFVLGWFSNFGSWIGTFDPIIGAEFRTGSLNERIVTSTDLSVDGISHVISDTTNFRAVQTTTGRISQNVKSTSNIRTVLYAEPERELFFQNNFTPYTVAASISLAVQKKLKIPKRVLRASPFRLRLTKKHIRNLPLLKYIKYDIRDLK